MLRRELVAAKITTSRSADARDPIPVVVAMTPVDRVTPVVAMVNRMTPIAIVMPMAMLAPVDRLDDTVCRLYSKHGRRWRSLN